jgi:hypothetical protein
MGESDNVHALFCVRAWISYLQFFDVHRVERSIPPCWELHGRCISLLVLNEANPNDVLLFILKEKTNALETTRVSRPTPRAGHAPRETFCLIPI